VQPDALRQAMWFSAPPQSLPLWRPMSPDRLTVSQTSLPAYQVLCKYVLTTATNSPLKKKKKKKKKKHA
jgi:hypothetical protein